MTRPVARAAIAFGCGCLLFLSCANFDIWPLAWIAWAPVIWIVLDEHTEHAWAYGFICGLAGNAGGFYWFVPYLQRFANLPFIAALPIFLLLIAYQATTWALFCHVLRRLRKDAGVPVTFLAPIVYVAVEAVVPYIFVWYLAITQAWVLPVIQIAELTGPLGVSFLIMLCNAMAYDAVRRWRGRTGFPRRRVLAASGVLAACIAFGFVRIHQERAARDAAPKLKVGVVQANVGVNQKFHIEDARRQLATHQKLSADLEQAGAELILWPETSYPYMLRRDRVRDFPSGDPRRARAGFQTPLIFGALTLGSGPRYPYNSAMLLDTNDEIRGRFDKNILILFGEYIPYFEALTFIKRWVPETDNYARGTDVTILPFESRSGAVRVGPMICYEDIFPSFGRRLARRGPELLVNLTNDAWFGSTSEPWQHLALSVYRAVELRVDLVRAVNTGVSAFVDSTGRVYAATRTVDPDDTRNAQPDTLLEEVAVQQAQTLYATLGEWFGGTCIAITFLLFLRVRTREGVEVHWRLVAVGAAAVLGFVVLVTVFTAPRNLGLVFRFIVGRLPPGSTSTAVEFAVAWRVLLGALAGSFALGFLMARRLRSQPHSLERALAVVAIWLPIAATTLEGRQLGPFIAALSSAALARFGARVAGSG